MMNILLLILGMAAVTYPVRAGLWLGKGHIPARVKEALAFVPTAVLTAIVVPIVLLKDEHLYLDWHNAQLVGALVTGLIVWRTRHLLAGIGGGLIVFAAWHWII
ncbi:MULTISPECIES: AzlD domain-containing protein [Silvimonas]|uniref:AzlD domain-containing protein n=1 Tax=Silvimonas TaxID=300264 RepID=UPI0024B3A3CE|nr:MULTISPECIES: AzlD domain-containing protein [Silvimonas]MDR3428273.1 AzlD domain-containing protein [Silvimonas sp.]